MGEDAGDTRHGAESWVDRYVAAWESSDPGQIAALFTEDAVYRVDPFDSGWRGHEQIVQGWLGRKDEPGTTRFTFEVLACADDVAIIQGRTSYLLTNDEYANLWLVRLESDGRCSDFTEYWMKREA